MRLVVRFQRRYEHELVEIPAGAGVAFSEISVRFGVAVGQVSFIRDSGQDIFSRPF